MLLWRRRCGQRCAERDRELPSLLLMLVLTLPTAAGVVGQTFGVTRQAMRGHEDSVNCLDMMPNRALLISGSDDGSARMWDLRTLECVLGFEARLAPGSPLGPVTSLAVSKKHENLLFAASGPAVLLFDLRMPAVAHPLMIMVQEKATSVQPLWEHDISQISMHPSGEHLAAVDEGGSVSIIDLRHRANDPPRVTRLQTKHGALASSVRWRGGSVDTPDFRTHLFSAGFDMKVMLHRLNNELQDQAEKPVALYTHAHTSQPLPGRGTRGQRKKKNRNASGQGADAGDVLGLDQSGGLPMVNPPFVHAIDVTADGQTLAAACGDGALRTYAFEDPGSVKDLSERVWQRHRRSVTCVSFLPGSTRFPCLKLVTGSDDRRVILWNLEEPETRSEHPSEDSLILDIDHGLKPNWLHCRAIGCTAPGPHLFVSDTSNVISAYSFRS